jgi:hypothetical protein
MWGDSADGFGMIDGLLLWSIGPVKRGNSLGPDPAMARQTPSPCVRSELAARTCVAVPVAPP